jgi:putative salt-induced outer membrane protein
VEPGSNNASLGNHFAAQVSVNERLALRVGYAIRHDTDPSVGARKLDQLTAANVAYTIK